MLKRLANFCECHAGERKCTRIVHTLINCILVTTILWSWNCLEENQNSTSWALNSNVLPEWTMPLMNSNFILWMFVEASAVVSQTISTSFYVSLFLVKNRPNDPFAKNRKSTTGLVANRVLGWKRRQFGPECPSRD